MSSEQPILFTNVRIFDSSGSDPFEGEVLVTGNTITDVRPKAGDLPRDGVRVIDGQGKFLMSGLCDAHTHFSWVNSADLPGLGTMGVEEHTLLCARSAQTYVDYGYTMCVGAAAAKARLDVVIRDAINDGQIPGPRYLANCQEIAVTGGALVHGITAFADGPEEMRKQVCRTVEMGADLVELSMSGEEITGNQHAQDNYFSDEETLAATTEAHRRGLRVCSHARSGESVKMSVRNGVDIIYHASFVDDAGLDMLEAKKDEIFVAPRLNWLVATLNDAADFGYPPEAAEAAGYKHELECAIAGLNKMKERGIRILPGGDYGFAWTPHGTYARDLQHFVELLGYTPKEALLAATALGGQIMRMPDQLGQLKAGFLADIILIDGDPLEDITVLQDRTRIVGIMKDGIFHKDPGDGTEARPANSKKHIAEHRYQPDPITRRRTGTAAIAVPVRRLRWRSKLSNSVSVAGRNALEVPLNWWRIKLHHDWSGNVSRFEGGSEIGLRGVYIGVDLVDGHERGAVLRLQAARRDESSDREDLGDVNFVVPCVELRDTVGRNRFAFNKHDTGCHRISSLLREY